MRLLSKDITFHRANKNCVVRWCGNKSFLRYRNVNCIASDKWIVHSIGVDNCEKSLKPSKMLEIIGIRVKLPSYRKLIASYRKVLKPFKKASRYNLAISLKKTNRFFSSSWLQSKPYFLPSRPSTGARSNRLEEPWQHMLYEQHHPVLEQHQHSNRVFAWEQARKAFKQVRYTNEHLWKLTEPTFFLDRSNKTKGYIARTLAAVIKMLWEGQYKYISSKNLKAVIGDQDHLFQGHDQQDSHEFLIMLIDWLQSDLQTISVVS